MRCNLKGSKAVPMEYAISVHDGDCNYDEASVATVYNTTQDYLVGVAGKYANDGTLIHFGGETLPPPDVLNSSSMILQAMVCAGSEAQDARPRFSRGLVTTITENVKSVYYKAAFRPSQVQADSFTELFKSAALALTASPNANASAGAFISEWGNFIFDRAVLGASVFRTLYTQPDASDVTIQRAKARGMIGDFNGLLRSQDPSTAVSDVISENGKRYRFETSRGFNVGELNLNGGCDIGPVGGVNPEVGPP